MLCVCVCVCVCIYTCTHMYISNAVRLCVCVCIYTHTHTHTQTGAQGDTHHAASASYSEISKLGHFPSPSAHPRAVWCCAAPSRTPLQAKS